MAEAVKAALQLASYVCQNEGKACYEDYGEEPTQLIYQGTSNDITDNKLIVAYLIIGNEIK